MIGNRERNCIVMTNMHNEIVKHTRRLKLHRHKLDFTIRLDWVAVNGN